MKKRSIYILIASLLMLGIMAVMLIVFLGKAKEDFPDSITVSENGVTESVMTVRDLKLNPTESKEYSINLVCEASGSYYVTLDYEEKADGGMKPFVDVTVKLDGQVIYEGQLLSLLDGDELIGFEAELHRKNPVKISVVYTMPYEVGNEAQGTYSDFDIIITIEKS